MIQYFDLHSHILCGVDDGAKTPEEMYAMLEMAYNDGARAICLTPHYSPYLFGDTSEQSKKSFHLLCEYASKKHPDLHLFLGHELGYHHAGLEALNSGKCRSIASSRYVLVDFPERIGFFEIQKAMDTLQRSGYIPILAHAERYHTLSKQFAWIEEFVARGGVIQINASSVLGQWGHHAKKQWIKLLRKGLVHVIASDGHNLTSRQPKISDCMQYLSKHCSDKMVRTLVWDNPWCIVQDRSI